MNVFIVVNPDNWTDFSVFENLETVVSTLEKAGYSLRAEREIKASPRPRMFYWKDQEERIVYCREMNKMEGV